MSATAARLGSLRTRHNVPDTTEPTDTWRDLAACREPGVDLEAFYSTIPAEIGYAKRICYRCPVQPICLARSIQTREPYGVWGGIDEDERDTMLRRRRRNGIPIAGGSR